MMSPNVLHFFRGPLGSSEDFGDCSVATVIGRVELNGYQHTIFRRVSDGVVYPLDGQTPISMNLLVIEWNARIVAAAALLLQHVQHLQKGEGGFLAPFLRKKTFRLPNDFAHDLSAWPVLPDFLHSCMLCSDGCVELVQTG